MPNLRLHDDNVPGQRQTAVRRGALMPLPRQGEQLLSSQRQPSAADLLIKAGATILHRSSSTLASNGSLSNKRAADPHDSLAQAQNVHKKTRQTTINENSLLDFRGVKLLSSSQQHFQQTNGTSGKDLQATKAINNQPKDLSKASSKKSHANKPPEITKLIERRIKSISLNSNDTISQAKLSQQSISQSVSKVDESLAEDTDEVEVLHEVRPEPKQQIQLTTAAQSQQRNQEELEERMKSLLTYYKTPSQLADRPHIKDHDKTQLKDCHSEPHYAWDIFNYYRSREKVYYTEKYLNKHKQSEINAEMRAVLVDWMVELQESLEMNHETLYLAVKIMDRYLMKKTIKKSTFQLLGITALLIAAKFDERIPPAITDFVYTCDSAFTKQQVIRFEIEVLKTLDFFIGFPLSYRFLRRFARCCDCDFHTLTLARYILETSLMEYDLIEEHESKIAAAALFLAIEMLQLGPWSETFEFYTGYTEEELIPLMWKLNDMISAPKKQHLSTIRTKYEHQAFLHVAKIKPLPPQ